MRSTASFEVLNGTFFKLKLYLEFWKNRYILTSWPIYPCWNCTHFQVGISTIQILFSNGEPQSQLFGLLTGSYKRPWPGMPGMVADSNDISLNADWFNILCNKSNARGNPSKAVTKPNPIIQMVNVVKLLLISTDSDLTALKECCRECRLIHNKLTVNLDNNVRNTNNRVYFLNA